MVLFDLLLKDLSRPRVWVVLDPVPSGAEVLANPMIEEMITVSDVIGLSLIDPEVTKLDKFIEVLGGGSWIHAPPDSTKIEAIILLPAVSREGFEMSEQGFWVVAGPDIEETVTCRIKFIEGRKMPPGIAFRQRLRVEHGHVGISHANLLQAGKFAILRS